MLKNKKMKKNKEAINKNREIIVIKLYKFILLETSIYDVEKELIKYRENEFSNVITPIKEAYVAMIKDKNKDINFDLKQQQELEIDHIENLKKNTDFLDRKHNKLIKFIKGIYDQEDEILEIIEQNIENYKLSRISILNKAILMLAVYEMKNTKLDFTIIINEAINISKKYCDIEGSLTSAFNNSVLDKIKDAIYARK